MEDRNILMSREVLGDLVEQAWRMIQAGDMSFQDAIYAQMQAQEEVRATGYTGFDATERKLMTREVKTVLAIENYLVSYRTRCNEHGYKLSYEIRFRKKGSNISASGKTLADAKLSFINKMNGPESSVSTRFNDIAMEFFTKYHHKRVCEAFYKGNLRAYEMHIAPFTKKYNIKQVTGSVCRAILEEVESTPRMQETVYSLLNQIFKYAMNCPDGKGDRMISINPMAAIAFRKPEREHSTPLRDEEEKTILEAVAGTKYEPYIALLLYTGVRVGELRTVQVIDDTKLKAVNEKRKGGKLEYKTLPVNPMLKPYLEAIKEMKSIGYKYLRKKIRTILGEERMPKDFRTTFYTRCDALGINPVVRDAVVGHTSGKLHSTYSHLSDEQLCAEMQKFKY